jgi:diguanylate cyclase (GGDEF)-like protein/PAS domain S-box-containing protein
LAIICPRGGSRSVAVIVAHDEKICNDIAETLDALTERVSRYRVDDLTIIYCNRAWAAGHNLTPAQAVGRTLDSILTPAERDGLRSQLGVLGADNPFVADDQLRPAPEGGGRWVEWVDRYLPDADGDVVLSVGRDVTERHITELKLAESETRFRDLADKSADVVWRFVRDPTPHFDYMSPSVENILGYPPSVFLENFTALLAIIDEEGQELVTRAVLGEPMPTHCDIRFRHANGSTVIGELQITTIPGGVQGVGRDVTELRSLQQNLKDLALRDPLTGLANRRLLNELLEAGLARSLRSGLPLAVAFLDLDGLKTVNDAHGHDAGDIVLCETARRLMSMVRGVDVVARIGGDEFVIVYEPSDTDHDDLIRRVKRALSTPIEIAPSVSVFCPASIGNVDTRVVGHVASALLAAADAAMYEKKQARRHARHA